jgi:F0F1-type ATP synthase membrane subunit c/vacuolar-type H+-ATPase subunit K
MLHRRLRGKERLQQTLFFLLVLVEAMGSIYGLYIFS